jgi:hypothetical protein
MVDSVVFNASAEHEQHLEAVLLPPLVSVLCRNALVPRPVEAALDFVHPDGALQEREASPCGRAVFVHFTFFFVRYACHCSLELQECAVIPAMLHHFSFSFSVEEVTVFHASPICYRQAYGAHESRDKTFGLLQILLQVDFDFIGSAVPERVPDKQDVTQDGQGVLQLHGNVHLELEELERPSVHIHDVVRQQGYRLYAVLSVAEIRVHVLRLHKRAAELIGELMIKDVCVLVNQLGAWVGQQLRVHLLNRHPIFAKKKGGNVLSKVRVSPLNTILTVVLVNLSRVVVHARVGGNWMEVALVLVSSKEPFFLSKVTLVVKSSQVRSQNLNLFFFLVNLMM